MLKKCKVVMLPTKEKASIGLHNRLGLITAKSQGWDYNLKYNYIQGQHLYIISDDEIKEGDWCYHLGRKIITQWFNKPGSHKEKDALLKIIATTDSSLKYTDHRISPVPNFCDYPQPSQSFIEKYIEEYNKGNVITDVLVEYEEYGLCISCNKQGVRHCAHPEECGYAQILNRLKINPKDNTITIKQVKDSWDRPETIRLVLKMQHDYTQYKKSCHYGPNLREIAEWTDKWIKENL